MKRQVIGILMLMVLAVPVLSQTAEKKVLVYTKFGKGFVHNCVQACADAVVEIGKTNGFAVEVSNDPAKFTDENLSQYSVLVFDNTNNELFDTEAQKKALQKYIRSGGGLVGIHSASGGMRKWDWYAKLIGAKFLIHPPVQPLTITVVDRDHPSTAFLPETWQWLKDECYFHKDFSKDLRILLSVNVSTLKPQPNTNFEALAKGKSVPITWCHEFDGGRIWYTALGHAPEHFSDPTFRKHILGGIQWAMKKTGDVK